MKTSTLILLSTMTAGLLVGCGSASSSTSEQSSVNSSGQFIDSTVAGLNYVCSSGLEGTTDILGTFTCLSKDTVSFNINGYVLGEALNAKNITPRTLYPNDFDKSTNVAQLLQTLDSDGNPSNGITLDINSSEVQALSGVTVMLDQADFDSAIVTYIGKPLVDESTANAHLDISIANIENTNTGLTTLSTVIVMNGIDAKFCAKLENSQTNTFEGYANYEAFIMAGGSQNISYFEVPQRCDSYSAAGYCEVQDFSQILAGDGSCVQAITFPFIPGQEGNDDNEQEEVGISFVEYTQVYKPMMPNLRNDNIHFSGVAYSQGSNIDVQYQSMQAQEKLSDTLYFIGGHPLYGYEVYTDIYTSTTLSTQFYDFQSNNLSNEGDWNIIIENNVHTKQGENRSSKFSQVLATSTLHEMYLEQGLDIDFDENDKAQFMLTSNSQSEAYVTLGMNESAYLKVVQAFMTYVIPNN